MRIWCRKHDAWLSFRTQKGENYFINPSGYYIELPDRSLAPITARVAFPVVNCYPSIRIDTLELQNNYSPPSYFVYALREGQMIGQPKALRLSSFRYELDQILAGTQLSPPEKYVALRVLESGLVPEHVLLQVIAKLPAKGVTIGQELVASQLVAWEMLMGVCVDARVPSKIDPANMRKSAFLREWELAGEILVSMGKVNRSQLEYAIKIKREGSKSLGEILTAFGACSPKDVEESLELQAVLRDSTETRDIVRLGELLVKRGIIQYDELDEGLRRQQIASQPLAKLLVALGACAELDVEDFRSQHGYGFQGQIDDQALASWLQKTGRCSSEQLRQAMHIQMQGRQYVGEILIGMGMCSREIVHDTVSMQEDIKRVKEKGDGDGLRRLGTILLAKGKIGKDELEKAVHMQSTGRRALGEVLAALSGCSEQDVGLAVTLQKQWRERVALEEDRLGEVLVKRGFLGEDVLQQAVAIHINTGKPIGRVLVEENYCTPEEIIATLVLRDYKRQSDLNTFIKQGLAARAVPTLPQPAAPESPSDTNVKTTERLIGSWFKKND